jgi:Family of unknown function (DUF6221)
VSELVDFPLARIGDDVRRCDQVPTWRRTGACGRDGLGRRGRCPLCQHRVLDGTESVTKERFRDHMDVTHDRQRILAKCEAKRRIVAGARQQAPHVETEVAMRGESYVVHLLASVYANHSDYRPEWRP